MAERKKIIRFTEASDITLLKEVLAKNPFKTKSWAEIAKNINLDVDARRVRERTHLLLEQRKKANTQALKLSGVNEIYGGKETLLLDEALELFEEEQKLRKDVLEKANQNNQKCLAIRKRAMENLTPQKSNDDESDEVTPPQKKPTKSTSNTVLTYLYDKAETEKQMREEELKFRKEELQLQREKI